MKSTITTCVLLCASGLASCGSGTPLESDEAYVGRSCATSDWTGYKAKYSKLTTETVDLYAQFNLDSRMKCWQTCTAQFGAYSRGADACKEAVDAVYDAHSAEANDLMDRWNADAMKACGLGNAPSDLDRENIPEWCP